MKTLKHVQDIYTSTNRQDRIYLTEEGVHVRDVAIDAGLGEEVFIGHLSDVHFNYCDMQDFEEADPVLMSTLENRLWLAGGRSVTNARRCFSLLEDADQIVLNGDTLDYLSHGAMALMEKEVWEKHPDVIATIGGHEVARKMQGKVPDPTSRESRLAVLEAFWKHDIYYISRLIKEKVLVIGMCNDLASFTGSQKDRLTADIALARRKGYAILLFFHEPLATHDPAYRHVSPDQAMSVGDPAGFPRDFCEGVWAGNASGDEDTKAVYDLIINSADVVKAVFAGHVHSDFYLEIAAKTPEGADAVIPQYVHTASAYDSGHLMRILVK